MEDDAIGEVVERARGVLTREGMRALLVARLPRVLGVAAAAASVRPLVWRLHDAASGQAPLRALALASGGALLASAVLATVGWRGRPSLLSAARELDRALGLREVVASGYAFERDGRNDPMTRLATDRARTAVHEVDPVTVFTASRHTSTTRGRSKRHARAIATAGVALVIGVFVGSFDAALVDRLVHPITQRETAAADGLARAAEAEPPPAASPKSQAQDPQSMLADAARRAAEAVKRGDRKRALEALDDLRAASRAIDAEARDQSKALRALRDELEPSGEAARGDAASASDRPSASASESLKRMRDALEAASPGSPEDRERLRRMSERLARAELGAKARAESGESAKSGNGVEGGETGTGAGREGWSKAAAALREARDAAERGDREAMKRALERAERAIAAMERSRDAGSEQARAHERVMSRASRLDRSVRAAMRGERSTGASAGDQNEDGDGDGDREGDGDGKNGAGKSRREANGGGPPARSQAGQGGPGDGPGGGDRAPGAEARRVRVSGNLKARTDVREGERAVSAIQGMGRGDDPRAYREVFPSYDSAVEDGLRDELVPAARRTTVRRYFSSIRPGDESRDPAQK